jgi:membrane-bound lytic murein transglycosylase D
MYRSPQSAASSLPTVLVALLSAVFIGLPGQLLAAEPDDEASSSAASADDRSKGEDGEDSDDPNAPDATAAEDGEDSETEVPPTQSTEDARKAYEDVAEMRNLEVEQLRPVIVGETPGWTTELLAPRSGTLAALQLDAGIVPELHRGKKVPVGAELLGIPAVRKRFESTSVLGLTEHNQPSVRAYLDFFDGRGKPILARWIKRMGRYEPMIREKLRTAGLPEDLIYVAMIESGFSPRATSPASAVGVWQFIPTTGSEMGLRIDQWVDERRDPLKATDAAIKYLTYLHDKFGSWPLALAAYNGGPGLVANTIDRYNTNNYWFIQRRNGMYDETRRYVPKVLGAGLVTKNADIFGLDWVERDDAFDWEVVKLPPRTRLALVADACGVELDVIKELNPHYLRLQTPPGDEPYEVRIPAAKLERFTRTFDELGEREGLEHEEIVVRFGEDVGALAERVGVPPRVLRVANGLKKGERLRYGAIALVPKKAMGTWSPRKRGKKKTIVVPAKRVDVADKQQVFYEIKQGDTLRALGAGFGVNPADIVLWNNLDPMAKLADGMIIQLYVEPDFDLTTTALMTREMVTAVAMGSTEHKRLKRKKRSRGRFYHRVRSGESLWLIARKYRVTVKDLKRWNRKLRRSNILQPGQKIVVYRRR